MGYHAFASASLGTAILLCGGCTGFSPVDPTGEGTESSSGSDTLSTGSTTLPGTSGATDAATSTTGGATGSTTSEASTGGTTGGSTTAEGESSSGDASGSSSTGARPFCGDGMVDDGEACDDGDANSDTDPDACRTDCSLAACGDGVQDTDEACDNGDANSDTEADACRTDCALSGCGDGVIDTGEACDDDDADNDDGCSMVCAEELGFTCDGEPSVCEAASILINGDFEDSSGGDPIVDGNTFPFFFPGTALWFADLGTFVGAEEGMTPPSGTQMLRFDATSNASGGFTGCNIQQAIDMTAYAALIADGRVTVEVSSLFNRVSIATDSLFQLRLFAYSGDADGGFTELAVEVADVLADLDQDTWEEAETSLLLPPTTTFVVVSLDAVENVENNTSGPEFAGHYADLAEAIVVVAPPA